MPTILVVDDEPDIARLLSETFTSDGFTVRTAANGRHALDLLDQHIFDLALVDVWLPDLNGLDLVLQMKDVSPLMPVVIITCQPAYESAVFALRSGACDYVEKPFDLPYLRQVVRHALTVNNSSPQPWPRMDRQTIRTRHWLATATLLRVSLTEREHQVLKLLAAGWMDAEIADSLDISIKTVSNHVSSILAKMGARSRTEAAVWAVRAGVQTVNMETSLWKKGNSQ